MQTNTVDLDKAKQYLAELDLNYISDFMCSEGYPLPRWIKSEAEQCCLLYKNFLWLNKKHFASPLSSEFDLVPTREIDEFWHNHILYTQQYMKDCYYIFGHYFHHEPASLSSDLEKLIRDFEQTEKLYLEEFKTPLVLIKN